MSGLSGKRYAYFCRDLMLWGVGEDIQGWLPLLRGEGKEELGECLCEEVLVGDGEL